MPDRDKVIKGLKCCGSRPIGDEVVNEGMCNDCPYSGELYCGHNLTADALTLLKEQEPVEPKFEEMPGTNKTRAICGACGRRVMMGEHYNHYKDRYCASCGRAVKWPYERNYERYKYQHDIAKHYDERNEKIMQDRKEGMTYAAIGKKYFISTERARKICLKTERR